MRDNIPQGVFIMDNFVRFDNILQFIFFIMQFIYYICPMINLNLKIARIEKGWSQRQLADKVGASRQTIGLIEKGKYNPSLKLCIRISKELTKSLNDLFWDEN